jgi:hypothetical protein
MNQNQPRRTRPSRPADAGDGYMVVYGRLRAGAVVTTLTQRVIRAAPSNGAVARERLSNAVGLSAVGVIDSLQRRARTSDDRMPMKRIELYTVQVGS